MLTVYTWLCIDVCMNSCVGGRSLILPCSCIFRVAEFGVDDIDYVSRCYTNAGRKCFEQDPSALEVKGDAEKPTSSDFSVSDE